MNWLQLTQRLKLESGRTGPAITSLVGLPENYARLANWLADRWVELQRRPHGWSFMRRELEGAIVANTRGYTALALDSAASDFGRWLPPATEHYEVRCQNAPGRGWPLRWLPWEKFRVSFELSEHEPGEPAYWSIAPDDKLYVGPTPLANRTIHASYYRAPTAFIDGTSEPDMAAEFHMILVWGALMDVASFDAAPEVYTRAATNFDNIDTDMRARYAPQITVGFNRL